MSILAILIKIENILAIHNGINKNLKWFLNIILLILEEEKDTVL